MIHSHKETLPVPFILDSQTVWCIKCNRHVDFFSVIAPIYYPNPRDYFPKTARTGERIVTIKCHGEQFKMSSKFGLVPDTYVPYGII